MDVYVDTAARVWLLDFNPFGRVTDSLLFSYETDFHDLIVDEARAAVSAHAELCAAMAADAPGSSVIAPDEAPPYGQEYDFEFRIVDTPQATRPSNTMLYRLPKDLRALSAEEISPSPRES